MKKQFDLKNILFFPGSLDHDTNFKKFVPKYINIFQSVPCTLKRKKSYEASSEKGGKK